MITFVIKIKQDKSLQMNIYPFGQQAFYYPEYKVKNIK